MTLNNEMYNYLNSLNATPTMHQRVQKIYDFYRENLPENVEITDLFITEYITEDGVREYEHLWFFSNNYVMRAINFLYTDEFYLTVLKNEVYQWEIRGQDYDHYRGANEKSRLYLQFLTINDYIGELKASQKNCDYLVSILKKHITSNLSI